MDLQRGLPAVWIPQLLLESENSPWTMCTLLYSFVNFVQCTHNSPLPSDSTILFRLTSNSAWIFLWASDWRQWTWLLVSRFTLGGSWCTYKTMEMRGMKPLLWIVVLMVKMIQFDCIIKLYLPMLISEEISYEAYLWATCFPSQMLLLHITSVSPAMLLARWVNPSINSWWQCWSTSCASESCWTAKWQWFSMATSTACIEVWGCLATGHKFSSTCLSVEVEASVWDCLQFLLQALFPYNTDTHRHLHIPKT